MPHRPRRSALYMPGSKERALGKARGLSADVLLLDLEDAVSMDEKDNARDLVKQAVTEGGFGPREIIIRVNGLETEWGADDIAMAASVVPDAILIPKVNSAAEIETVAAMAPGVPLWAMMETALGILNAVEIAANPRVTGLVMGTNDLAKELHTSHDAQRLPLLTALSTCVMAGRAYGCAVLDGVYNAFKDIDGLHTECVQGKALGFDGKTLIHPAQLSVANTVFAPTAEELDEARTYVTAFETAQAQGLGVAVVNGRIVENLHVENAHRLLTETAAIAALAAASD